MKRIITIILFLFGLFIGMFCQEKTDAAYLRDDEIQRDRTESAEISFRSLDGTIGLNADYIVKKNVNIFSCTGVAGPSSGGFSIRPKTISGQVNISYKWTATHPANLSRIKYEWDFGDGSVKVSIQNDSNITHIYNQAGSYNIKLICYDNKNIKIGMASATAKIITTTARPKTEKTTTKHEKSKTTVKVKSDTVVIFDNGNISGVVNNPGNPTEFTIDKTYYVTSIQNYHWNNARGDLPGSIGLQKGDFLIGNWGVVKVTPGQGGVPNVNWICYPNIILKPGKYRVIDSKRTTWSNNPGSGRTGFSRVMGYVK